MLAQLRVQILKENNKFSNHLLLLDIHAYSFTCRNSKLEFSTRVRPPIKGQTMEHLLNVLETQCRCQVPNPLAHVVRSGNYIINQYFFLDCDLRGYEFVSPKPEDRTLLCKILYVFFNQFYMHACVFKIKHLFFFLKLKKKKIKTIVFFTITHLS